MSLQYPSNPILVALLSFLLSSSFVSALLEEEVGWNDWLIATSGHGVFTDVILPAAAGEGNDDNNAVITASPPSCDIASRSVTSGKLLWRTNVCSSTSTTTSTTQLSGVTASEDRQFLSTIDTRGMLRVWKLGPNHPPALVWDTPPGTVEGAWILPKSQYMVTIAASNLIIRSMKNGRKLETTTTTSSSPWISVLPVSSHEFMALRADFQLVTFQWADEDGLRTVQSVNLASDATEPPPLDTRTLQIGSDGNIGMVLTQDGQSVVQFGLSASDPFQTIGLSQWHPLWTSMTKLKFVAPQVLKITGLDDRYSPKPKQTSALFRYDAASQQWDQWYGIEGEEEGTQFRDIEYCPDQNIVLASVDDNQLQLYTVGDIVASDSADADETRGQRHRRVSPLQSSGPIAAPMTVAALSIVACDQISVLVATASQTTALLSLRTDSSATTTVWSVEDGLQTASSAILLDAVGSGETKLEADQDGDLYLQQLQWSRRLLAPLALLQQASHKKEQQVFGLDKMAVLVSQSLHRVWGIPTSQRGLVTDWTLDLPASATRHVLVHGTANANTFIHGINGGTATSELLILSTGPNDDLVWHCLDGISGTVLTTGTLPTPSSVVQILPIAGSSSSSCRQAAILLHEDRSVSMVPPGSDATAVAQLEKSQNGFHAHTVDRTKSVLESYQIVTSSSSGFAAQLVGQSSFPGETIVGVTYPQRDEAVQSPSTVLGDDSLLLKYLNPHLAVIMTTASNDDSITPESGLLKALGAKKESTKRKPKGASSSSKTGDTSEASNQVEELPNLFVNIVDTVSGRILYRTSHTNAVVDKPIPAVISENWILYSFLNKKAARTELGVLTLYEGMIDKAGLTAFKTPGQTLSFSSLDSRESKPIVLAKTYAIVKPVTALGVSTTRGGISTRQVLIATGDHKLTAIKRSLLEPRRPTGDVKDHEKQEGLFQYTPLVPLVSMASPSYNQTVERVASIVAAPAALESSSLVLAFGGPDLFFTRLTPSKGFDMLPETFNRPLLSVVVVGLLVAVFVVRNMSERKAIKMGWS